jgi:predicted Fe-S protein YdhL (DUF1289 family)
VVDIACNPEPVDSPCVDICRLDDDGCCVGCFRTGQEIADWLAYSVEQRRTIMKRLAARAGDRFQES